MKKIYLASPFGFSEAGRKFMYDVLIPTLEKAGFSVIDPWKLTDEAAVNKVVMMPYGTQKKEEWKKLNKVIAKKNEEAIKKCDVVFAVLDGTDVDSGTASEIGYACAIGKKIIGYRGDFRLSADNEGSIVNLQLEYFITKNGGEIISKVEDIKEGLKKIFK